MRDGGPVGVFSILEILIFLVLVGGGIWLGVYLRDRNRREAAAWRAQQAGYQGYQQPGYPGYQQPGYPPQYPQQPGYPQAYPQQPPQAGYPQQGYPQQPYQ